MLRSAGEEPDVTSNEPTHDYWTLRRHLIAADCAHLGQSRRLRATGETIGATNSTDALLTLQKGVGQLVVLDCGICPPTTTTTTTTMPGGGTGNCTNNGNCSGDDCVCSDPASCNNDGTCKPFQEGCVCADCMTHPECLDN